MNRRSRLGGASLAAALAAAVLAAAPAHAAPQWHDGTIESSTVANCNFFPETGIIANAQLQADPDALPRVGDVFYVRTVPARVGNGCGIDMSVHVEVVLPAGVTTAITPATPVRCLYWDFMTDESEPAPNCPQEEYEGVYGPAFDQLTPGGPHETRPWPVPYGKGIVIEIPLKSSRQLVGGGSGSPSCGRLEGDPPCPAAQSGDNLQFADKVIDGWASPWLSPYVPLFVEAAAPGGSGDGEETPGGGGDGSPGGGTSSTGGASTGGGTSTGGAPAGGGTSTRGASTGGRTSAGGAPAGGATATETLTAARVLAAAPGLARRAQLRRRGLPLAVRVVEAGSKVTATLRLGRKTIARRTLRGAEPGTVALRLKASKAGARRLARLRRATRATLKVVVREPGGRSVTATRKLTIRR